ncbi:MAG: DMT family transporter [Paludibacter sp.]|jgi:drug/metabolite transporter (DMT)-like permease|nr:DMT family transporter [Paludibacter sp.]
MQSFKMYGAVVLAMVFWAFSFIWTQMAIESFPPVTLVSLRLILASLILYAYARATGKLQRLRREDLRGFILLAFFEPFLYYMGETYALTMMSPTLVSVIVATIPLFAPLLAYFMLHERITKSNVAGIVVSIIGVLLVIYVPGTGMYAEILGIVLVFVAVFSAVFYSTTLRRISSHYTITSIVLYQSLIGILFFLPVFLVVDLPVVDTMQITTKSLGALLMLSLFASVLAFVFFGGVVRKIGIAKSNVFVNLIPVFTALFSWLLLDQYLTFTQWMGILVVVLGLFVSQLNRRSFKSQKQEIITKVTEY